MNVSGRMARQMASVFALQDWKDVGLTHTGMHGRTSGGTNLPVAEAGVTGWFESKCSDTGEGAVKRLEHRFEGPCSPGLYDERGAADKVLHWTAIPLRFIAAGELGC